MKRVAFFQWKIWNIRGTEKTITAHFMSEETALARHFDAEKVESTLEWRDIPEKPAEEYVLHRQSAQSKTEEALLKKEWIDQFANELVLRPSANLSLESAKRVARAQWSRRRSMDPRVAGVEWLSRLP